MNNIAKMMAVRNRHGEAYSGTNPTNGYMDMRYDARYAMDAENYYEPQGRTRHMRMNDENHSPRYDEAEMRTRDRRGREHYDNGRYAPMRSEMRGDYGTAYGGGSNAPHMQKGRYESARRQIGFSVGGRDDDEYDEVQPLDRLTAERWVHEMKNADESKGAHWKPEQVKTIMAQRGIEGDPWEWYAILNSLYSDYGEVFKKHGVGDRLEFYLDMAKAWLEDEDAEKNKAALYYKCIVKK